MNYQGRISGLNYPISPGRTVCVMLGDQTSTSIYKKVPRQLSLRFSRFLWQTSLCKFTLLIVLECASGAWETTSGILLNARLKED